MSNTFTVLMSVLCLSVGLIMFLSTELRKQTLLRNTFKEHIRRIYLPCHVAYFDETLEAPDLTFNYDEVLKAYSERKLYIEADLYILKPVKDLIMLRQFIKAKYGISGTLNSIAKNFSSKK